MVNKVRLVDKIIEAILVIIVAGFVLGALGLLVYTIVF